MCLWASSVAGQDSIDEFTHSDELFSVSTTYDICQRYRNYPVLNMLDLLLLHFLLLLLLLRLLLLPVSFLQSLHPILTHLSILTEKSNQFILLHDRGYFEFVPV